MSVRPDEAEIWVRIKHDKNTSKYLLKISEIEKLQITQRDTSVNLKTHGHET